MAKFILGAVLALVLVGCGGGDGSSDAPPKRTPLTVPGAGSLVAIGNSITVYPADPSLGWTHTSGMAASDEAHDYVHLVGAGLGVPVAAFNVAPIETDASRMDLVDAATGTIDNRTVVILEIGENAPSGGSTQFLATYGQVLDAIAAKHPAALLCLSDYWVDRPKDALKRAACAARGGLFIDVSGVYFAHLDTPPPGESPELHDHPHDPSMASLAQVILGRN